MDSSDPASVRKRDRELGIQKVEDENFWRSVLNHPVGRRNIWQLLEQGHAFNSVFAPHDQSTWFHAGQQQFVLGLYRKLGAIDRAAMLQMHAEHDPVFTPPVKDE